MNKYLIAQNIFSGLKVNLNLHITGRRENGYHELSSFVSFCPDKGDMLSFWEMPDAVQDTLEMSGQFAGELRIFDAKDNLILRAISILRKYVPKLPFIHVALQKDVPLASGVGGGSCDAACAIRVLAHYYKINLSAAYFATEFLALGADMPVCLYGKNAIMQGIGEDISPIPYAPEFGLLLVNPLVKISAKECYDAFKCEGMPFSDDVKTPPQNENIDEWQRYLQSHHNDLLSPAIKICPEIEYLISRLNHLEGAFYAAMSGSGATCFALFEHEAQAIKAQQALRLQKEGFWSVSGKTGNLI